MKHRWAIFCSNASVDKESNSLTLFGVIEDLQIRVDGPAPPSSDNPLIAPFQAVLVVLNERSEFGKEESCTGRVRIIDPNGAELGITLFEVKLTDHARIRSMIRFQNFMLTVSGQYRLAIEYQNDNGEWDEAEVVPITVTIDFGPLPENKDPQPH